jgi:hypothetical protein
MLTYLNKVAIADSVEAQLFFYTYKNPFLCDFDAPFFSYSLFLLIFNNIQ